MIIPLPIQTSFLWSKPGKPELAGEQIAAGWEQYVSSGDEGARGFRASPLQERRWPGGTTGSPGVQVILWFPSHFTLLFCVCVFLKQPHNILQKRLMETNLSKLRSSRGSWAPKSDIAAQTTKPNQTKPGSAGKTEDEELIIVSCQVMVPPHFWDLFPPNFIYGCLRPLLAPVLFCLSHFPEYSLRLQLPSLSFAGAGAAGRGSGPNTALLVAPSYSKSSSRASSWVPGWGGQGNALQALSLRWNRDGLVPGDVGISQGPRCVEPSSWMLCHHPPSSSLSPMSVTLAVCREGAEGRGGHRLAAQPRVVCLPGQARVTIRLGLCVVPGSTGSALGAGASRTPAMAALEGSALGSAQASH